MARASKASVIQKPEAEEVPIEILAQSIRDISLGMKKLYSSGLKDDVVEHLIAWKSGVSIGYVRNVLWCLDNLEAQFLKKKN